MNTAVQKAVFTMRFDLNLYRLLFGNVVIASVAYGKKLKTQN
jgi:hypothetical protein